MKVEKLFFLCDVVLKISFRPPPTWIFYYCAHCTNKLKRKLLHDFDSNDDHVKPVASWGRFRELIYALHQTICAQCPTFEKLFNGAKVQPKAQKKGIGRKTDNDIDPWSCIFFLNLLNPSMINLSMFFKNIPLPIPHLHHLLKKM